MATESKAGEFTIDNSGGNFLNEVMLRTASLLLLSLSFLVSTAWAGSMGYSSISSSRLTMTETDLFNTTLLGEKMLARQVVCRSMWGTPMPPDGKGGYSLIAPVNPSFIAMSNIIPPLTDGPVYRPRLSTGTVIITTAPK
ncbi:MAG: hypothetical protein ABI615_06830 [Chthoniobacterales bacterium]